MKRGPGPSRSSGLRRTTRLAPSRKPIRPNKTRKQTAFQRAYGSKARVAFVKSLPCVARSVACMGEIENAHVVKGDGGMSHKASAEFIAPMCARHHYGLHRVGADAFAREHGLDLAACASETERRWREAEAGSGVDHEKSEARAGAQGGES